MKISTLRTFKKILILGYGIEGRATERFIQKYHTQAKIGISDVHDGEDYLDKQKDYDLIIRSPSIHPKWIIKPYTTATNIFLHNVKGTVVGVTGTKGKSTTASLIYHVLASVGIKVYLCGNIGNPALDVLIEDNSLNSVYVLEMSSYQLIDATKSPHFAILLNTFPEHMDYHGSIQAYYRAKSNIFAYQKKEHTLIINKRDFFTNEILKSQLVLLDETLSDKRIKDHSIYSLGSDFQKKVIDYMAITLPRKMKTTLLGEHNMNNIRAAYALIREMNISEVSFNNALLTFKPLKHRLEYVGTYKNIQFYDDAISTTPESTIAALQSLPNIGSLLLGGKNRGYHFKHLAKGIEERKIQTLVLFPDSGKEIERAFSKKFLSGVRILHTTSMEIAVQFCFKYTRANSICLLSCASPSYSLWKNYEEKGDQFVHFVKKYGAKNQTSIK